MMNWIQIKHPKLEIKAIQKYIRVNITFYTKMIKEGEKNIKNELNQFKKNINGYRLKYLFKTSASIKYKIKFLSLMICPNILVELYNMKMKK